MRTVTFTTSEQQGQFDARQRYEPSPPDGTYLLLRVTPGAEPTVEWPDMCGKHLNWECGPHPHQKFHCGSFDAPENPHGCFKEHVALVRGMEPQ